MRLSERALQKKGKKQTKEEYRREGPRISDWVMSREEIANAATQLEEELRQYRNKGFPTISIADGPSYSELKAENETFQELFVYFFGEDYEELADGQTNVMV